jgi:endonuclease I
MNNIYCQYGQADLFPEIEGEELLDKIIEEYKAQILFYSYGESRDTLFSKVYAVDDSLTCVYSGHTLYMDPDKDPTVTVYLNGDKDGINTEHTFPRSKGAEFGNAKSDMHHLYPTRSKVNEERSNFPFGEINDEETDLWFYKDKSLINKPTENIDKYSEWKWEVFEPREDHKGNVARAMMYFYTMYKDQADERDPNFFKDMTPNLCEWHFLDPVDSLEWARTNIIAKYQQFPNPFVLDCSLASRTYCDILNDACQMAVSIQENESLSFEGKIFYAADIDEIILEVKLKEKSHLLVQFYNVHGQLVFTKNLGKYSSGSISENMATPDAFSGILFARTIITSNSTYSGFSNKLIIP